MNRIPDLVSIVIPSFQRAHLIEQAIRSALQQTHANIEVLVVDDGSTDRTEEVVKGIAAGDVRVRYIKQNHGGVSSARNTAIKNSRGEFIAFLDSDDSWLPDKLNRQMDIFKTNQDIDFVYCSGYVIDSNGERNQELTDRLKPANAYKAEDILFGRANFFTSGIMFRSSCLESAGLFDESMILLEDQHLWFRILLHHRAHFLDEELLVFRRHAENTEQSHAMFVLLSHKSLLTFRQKLVALYEGEGAPLSRREKENLLFPPHLDVIKESFANGRQREARMEIVYCIRNYRWKFRGLLYLLFSILPADLASDLVRRRRNWNINRRERAEAI